MTGWPGDTRPLFLRALEARAVMLKWRQWRAAGAHADPFNRAMVDAIRHMLGLGPLYEPEDTRKSRRRGTVERRDSERFAAIVYSWPGGAP